MELIDIGMLAAVGGGVVAVMMVILKQHRLQRELRDLRDEVRMLKTDMKALFTGAAGMGSHLAQVEGRIKGLTERHDPVDFHEPGMQNYNQAIDMVQRGADVDEVMRRCGLLREEAELLIRLHGNNEAAVD